MSSPTRFLVVLLLGWVGVRAATLGLVPGSAAHASQADNLEQTGRRLAPPPVTNLLPPGYEGPSAWAPMPAMLAAPAIQPMPYPVIPAYAPQRQVIHLVEARSTPSWSLPPARAVPAAQSLAPAMAASWPDIGGSVASQTTPPLPPAPAAARFDRVQLSAWATMRDRPGSQGLAGTGTLGGSQAGMRLLYRVDPRLAVSLRTSAPLGTARRGGDVALGARYTPFGAIPLSLTLERRQGFGDMDGPTGFALFAEGGLNRPIGGWRLDSYAQGGAVIGKDGRMLFADGAAVMTRPLWRNLDAGFGVWGAAQPGLTRLDAGPRLSMRFARGIRVHADYRFKAAGNAQPGSGGVVTMAGDF